MSNTLQNLYNKLGFTKENGLYDLSEIDKCKGLALRYKQVLINIIKPNAIYCLNNEPFILFFEINNSKNEQEEIKKIHKNSWNFNQAPIIIILTETDLTFYNAFDFDKKEFKLSKFIDENESSVLSFSNIHSGKFLETHSNIFKSNKRANELLLNHIKTYRDSLIESGLSELIANTLIARMIFLRYLQDRKVEFVNDDNFKITDILVGKDKLYKFFNYLKSKFNGDLFAINENEENLINQNHLDILKMFLIGAKVSGQLPLFDLLDFSIIPVELVSRIYEHFLDYKKYKNKSYFTPTFLVDYIVNETIVPFLSDKNDSNCMVLDPACGSGIFLIESLRKIISKETELKQRKLLPEELKDIVTKNIFGIDKDENAINIAIFSLYITMLDYQEPASIVNFILPKLKDNNFFNANFFDEKTEFNTKFKNIRPDFIFSNPPYGSKDIEHLEYAKKNGYKVSRKEIAQSFLIRAKDFSKDSTKCAMVVTSKILYNLQAIEYRKKFLQEFSINQIFELSSVRHQVFDGADTPVSIIFYEFANGKDTSNNKIKHISLKPNIFFSLFKVFVIEKFDNKKILQKYFLEYDWLWKVMLYGNILDFYFIKRITDNFKTVYKLKNDKEVISGQGFIFSSTDKSDKNDAAHLIGKTFLDADKGMLGRFFIDLSKSVKFKEITLHRPRNPELFKAPFVLVKKGIGSDFSCISAFADKDMVFTQNITSIKFKDNDINKLYNLTGILNSTLFNYLILNKGSSTAVEREVVLTEEYLTNTPYVYKKEIADIVKQIQAVKLENKDSSSLEVKLNELVFEAFDIDESEKDLIDYTLNVSIPIWHSADKLDKRENLTAFNPVTSEQLKNYAEIFHNYFKNHYENFHVDIYKCANYTLMNFIARSDTKYSDFVSFEEDSNKINAEIEKIEKLSHFKITNKIYLIRDIKGFEENSFYVIKLNEYKNWHKSIARLDLNEFTNAIWEAEVGSIKA